MSVPVVIGEKNGSARLTAAIVETCRLSYATRRTTLGILARRYGVSRATMWKVIHGVTWRHVWMPPPPTPPATSPA